MKLSLGFSPCPNDTFIFDALVNKKINTADVEFELLLEDVQTLNEQAIDQKLDIVKISYATLPLVLDHYVALRSGGALGKGVGPLLISKVAIPDPAVRQCIVAVPGQHTTANVLFSLAYPEANHKVFLRYDKIEEFVLSTEEDSGDPSKYKLGVIIHENRFTYEQKGLTKLADLGDIWEKQTGFPIPLGCIVIRRNIDDHTKNRIQELIKESIQYAWKEYPRLGDFITSNAREMEEKVMRQHIDLYVNAFTDEVGEEGQAAVEKFIQVHSSINKLDVNLSDIFLR
ncbi:MAG TPA: 1,4-dihydroxy-6-naphthoate synthase [Flavitalea sp.]|nr:1,4-dihydroxy-6-naphthoate synthase [Flavitalea sp.]